MTYVLWMLACCFSLPTEIQFGPASAAPPFCWLAPSTSFVAESRPPDCIGGMEALPDPTRVLHGGPQPAPAHAQVHAGAPALLGGLLRPHHAAGKPPPPVISWRLFIDLQFFQGLGFLCMQEVAGSSPDFRVAATGTILESDCSHQVVKKLKLVGYPQKIFKNTCFVKVGITWWGLYTDSFIVNVKQAANTNFLSSLFWCDPESNLSRLF